MDNQEIKGCQGISKVLAEGWEWYQSRACAAKRKEMGCISRSDYLGSRSKCISIRRGRRRGEERETPI